ncbi:MAG: hypothetical protein A3F91_08945 [Flavobacteria bacterium RIFCSPLOWO2_12_FULL_35_11]|nr:MAG: hypothetical protein A3F91_08945 [Flavobacteria bacterium RIFCSPLOWO2_12_FULL_35_11]
MFINSPHSFGFKTFKFMKKILLITINQIQQKTTQIAIIGLLILFVMISSLYLMYTVFSNI